MIPHAYRVVALLLSFLAAAAASSQVAPFPLIPGVAVGTCFSDAWNPASQGFVLGVIDVRNPPPALVGENWPAPMYHHPRWTVHELGEVFGVTLDPWGNIYVASTIVYGNRFLSPSSGKIFRLDAATGDPSLFATLPNSGIGLGNLCYDRWHNRIFVTNFEDGTIYRLSQAGAVLDSYDPLDPDDGRPGLAPLGERLWGVGVYKDRLYYSVWGEECNHQLRSELYDVEIRSVGLDGDGAILPATDRREIRPPSLNTMTACSSPVSDITFSGTGTMLVAERSMGIDVSPNAHVSRVLEYTPLSSGWSDPRIYRIGEYFNGDNSAGGADYAYGGFDPITGALTGCEETFWASGDALRYDLRDEFFVYGIARVRVGVDNSTTSATTSHYIDLNGVTNVSDKTQIGDVAVVRDCIDPLQGSSCYNHGILLEAPPGSSYRWSPAVGLSCTDCRMPTASPATATVYVVTVTDAFGHARRKSYAVTGPPTSTLLRMRLSLPPLVEIGSDVTIASHLDDLPDPLGLTSVTAILRYDPLFLLPTDTTSAAIASLLGGTRLDGWSVASLSHQPGRFVVTLNAPPGDRLRGTGLLLPFRFISFIPATAPTLSSWGWQSVVSLSIDTPADSCTLIASARDSTQLHLCGLNNRLIELTPGAKYALDVAPNTSATSSREIRFALGLDGPTRLEILDVAGRVVATLVDGRLPEGEHVMRWEAAEMPQGIYFCRLRSGTWSEIERMVLVR